MSLYILPSEIFYFKTINNPQKYLNIKNEIIFSNIIDISIYNNITNSISFGGIFSYLSITDFGKLRKVSKFFREQYFFVLKSNIIEEFFYYNIMKKYLKLDKYYNQIF